MTQVRTRFAPSPTGFLHIGGVRTALYCYLFTRKMGGAFLLRIEDTDRTRYVPGAEEYFIEALEWCGIKCDEGVHVGGDYGPYRQSDRKHLYRKYADILVERGHAYYAFDTSEELDEMRKRLEAAGGSVRQYNAITRGTMKNSMSLPAEEVKVLMDAGTPYVIRAKIPADEEVVVFDEIRGTVRVNTNTLDDKVLFKADGMPTYHLANIVDDHLMEITHVIRGEEWLPSTPLHVLLYRFFGWQDTMPKFAHLPLIMKPTGKGKLSKRDGDKMGFPVFPLAYDHPLRDEKASGFRETGFLPEAFVNMLAFLGWNPGTEQEIFSMDELIDSFSIDRVSKSGARFNYEKAKWFNEEYIKAMSNEDLAAKVLAIAPDNLKNTNSDWLAQVCGLFKERITFLKDFWEQAAFLFAPPTEYHTKTVRKRYKAHSVPVFEELKGRLAGMDCFEAADVETTIKGFISEKELSFSAVLPVFRVMLSGVAGGPSLFDICALLGQDEVIGRMAQFMEANPVA